MLCFNSIFTTANIPLTINLSPQPFGHDNTPSYKYITNYHPVDSASVPPIINIYVDPSYSYIQLLACQLWKLDSSTHQLSSFTFIYCNLSARLAPYQIVARKDTKFTNEEAPCIFPNALFNFCISLECGAAS